MALETATYVGDLVATNPTSGDPKSQGDDHLRLLKSTLQATLPVASAPIYPLVTSTAQATTSGAAVDFSSIPSWVKRITISFSDVSASSADPLYVVLGDSGGLESTGYSSMSSSWITATAPSVSSYTTGFGIYSNGATMKVHGVMVLTLLNASTNLWCCSGTFCNPADLAQTVTAGSKALSSTLTQLRITPGSGTLDSGSVNILYE